MNYFVYMVQCCDDTLYTGMSNDVGRRIYKHNAGTGARYTKARRPVKLVYLEKVGSKGAALRREYAIKQFPRSKKLKLADLA